jgi:hypothetical protein
MSVGNCGGKKNYIVFLAIFLKQKNYCHQKNKSKHFFCKLPKNETTPKTWCAQTKFNIVMKTSKIFLCIYIYSGFPKTFLKNTKSTLTPYLSQMGKKKWGLNYDLNYCFFNDINEKFILQRGNTTPQLINPLKHPS